MGLSVIGELLMPWQIQPTGLNVGEAEELLRRRNITAAPSGGKMPILGVVNTSTPLTSLKGNQMSLTGLVTVVKRIPAVLNVEGKLVGALAKSKNVVFASASDMWKWAASDKANALAMLSILGTLGVSLADFIQDTDFYKGMGGLDEKDRVGMAESIKIGENYRSAVMDAFDGDIETAKPKTKLDVGDPVVRARIADLIEFGKLKGYGFDAVTFCNNLNKLEELLALPDSVRKSEAEAYFRATR